MTGDDGVGGDGDGDGAVLVVTRAVASFWTWVVPNVATTGEKVLEGLGGGGEVLLIDDVGSRPQEGGGGDGSGSGD
jgi:hypothetical protein